MQLTATVVLDEKTTRNLRQEIKKEVIQEMKNNQDYEEALLGFLVDSDYTDYLLTIMNTIGSVIDKVNEEGIPFESNKIRYRKLLAIKAILDI